MSMFREHYIGGLVAYTLFFVLSLGASLFGQIVMQVPLERNPTIPFNPWSVGACFVVAVLSGLWPRRGTSRAEVSRSFIGFSLYLASY